MQLAKSGKATWHRFLDTYPHRHISVYVDAEIADGLHWSDVDAINQHSSGWKFAPAGRALHVMSWMKEWMRLKGHCHSELLQGHYTKNMSQTVWNSGNCPVICRTPPRALSRELLRKRGQERRRSDTRLFQARASWSISHWKCPRSPSVDGECWTNDVLVDLRRRRASTSVVKCIDCARYGGAVPWRQRCARTHSWNWILSETFSQQSSRRSEVLCALISSLRTLVVRRRSTQTVAIQTHQPTPNNKSRASWWLVRESASARHLESVNASHYVSATVLRNRPWQLQ